MSYKHLSFAQYFLDTSEDFNHTGQPIHALNYQSISYPCTGKLHRLLGREHEVNYAFLYDEARDVIQIHFEKTMGFTDWFANFEFAAEYYDAIEFEGAPLQLRVHRGWAEMYLAAKRVIRAEWQRLHEAHPTAETEILGWSLGSGQAMLCAQDLNYNFGLQPRVFTYGSVKSFRARPEEEAVLGRYLASLCTECWNFADNNDIVTDMPPFRGCTDIRRVGVSTKKRRFWRLMNPWKYHAYYDKSELYRGLPKKR